MVALQIGLWRSFSMWIVCLRTTFNLDTWCTCQCYCGCTTALGAGRLYRVSLWNKEIFSTTGPQEGWCGSAAHPVPPTVRVQAQVQVQDRSRIAIACMHVDVEKSVLESLSFTLRSYTTWLYTRARRYRDVPLKILAVYLSSDNHTPFSEPDPESQSKKLRKCIESPSFNPSCSARKPKTPRLLVFSSIQSPSAYCSCLPFFM